MFRRRLSLSLIVLALVAAACADDAETGGTDTEPPASTAAPTTDAPTTEAPTTEAPATTQPPTTEAFAGVTVEATPIVGVLDLAYSASGDPADFLFPPGSVMAHWYLSATSGNYAVVYTGAPIGMDLCPGNSIFDGAAFSNVSNTPTDDPAACEGFPTTGTAATARVCGNVIIYETMIPAGATGELYGTLEVAATGPAGISNGATSIAAADASVTPTLDTAATAYAFPAEMGGEIVC